MAFRPPWSAAEAGPALFADVGANVGWFALQVGAAGHRVAAFEPMPRNLQLLRTSVCANDGALLNGRVVVYPMALGDKPQDCAIVSCG